VTAALAEKVPNSELLPWLGHRPKPRAAGESACRPGSVRPLARAGGHPSRTAVADSLMRSTREHRAGSPQSLAQERTTGVQLPLDLAPGGVYQAAQVALSAGGLLHHRFTLTSGRVRRRSVFCGTIPRVTPGRRYRPPCPAEPGPSSAHRKAGMTRPPGQLARRCIQDIRQWPGCASHAPPGNARAGGPGVLYRHRPPRRELQAASSVNKPAEQAAVLTIAAVRLRRS